MFFVLSGYLITALLVQEIQTTNELGFARFYARRLRRLLPALLLMLLCVGISGWLLLPYNTQFRQADAAGNAAFSLSNFFFGISNLGYFSPDAKANLFLHTWSLGIEEQFYLLWPLLIVIAAGAWSNAKRRADPSRLKIIMPALFAASLALCIYWSYQSPHLAFYMMPSRAWQFALGALVFMFFGIRKDEPRGVRKLNLSKQVAWGSSWLGLAMILIAAVLFNKHITYPSAWALLPSLGAALLIAAGTHYQTGRVVKALSTRPMQAIGRVSYSWYLWHWPVLLLGSSVFFVHSVWGRLGLALLSLLIATVAYHFVEKPIRRQKHLVNRPRVAIAASIAVMGLAVVAALGWHREIASELALPAVSLPVAATWDLPSIYSKDCDSWYHNSKVTLCSYGAANAQHTVVIMGDSISLQWFPTVRRVFRKSGWKIIAITKSSCPMVDFPYFYGRIDREYTQCTLWRERALQKAIQIKPDILIFSSYYKYPFTRDQWIRGTRDILRKIDFSTRQIFIIRPTPVLPFNGPDCLAPRSALYNWLKHNKTCSTPANTTRFNDVYDWLETAIQPFHNVKMLDMTRFVCPNDVCQARLNGKIVFRDTLHMTASFARSLAPDLAMEINSKNKGSRTKSFSSRH